MRKAEATEAAKVLNERRYQQLTAEERAKIARDAALARWARERDQAEAEAQRVAVRK